MSLTVAENQIIMNMDTTELLRIPGMEDTELVRLCQSGDITAFDRLFQKYRDKIYNTAYRMINNQEDALDLTQEIFLKMYQKIGKFSYKSTFSTWLYRLAVNVCIDELRKRKKNNEMPLPDSFSQTYADNNTPEDHAISNEEEHLIWEAIGSLKEKERAILILRDVEGLSYNEIADIFKCSMGRVKSRIHEARGKLKIALEKRAMPDHKEA